MKEAEFVSSVFKAHPECLDAYFRSESAQDVHSTSKGIVIGGTKEEADKWADSFEVVEDET